MEFQEKLIILRKVDFKDFNLIVDFFSLRLGKITSHISSAKRIKSKNFFPYQLGDQVIAKYSSNPESAFIRILDLKLSSRVHSNSDYTRFISTSFVLELTNTILPKSEPADVVYRELLGLLESKESLEILLLRIVQYILTLTHDSGVMFNFESCRICHQPSILVDEREIKVRKKKYSLDRKEGGIICESCGYSGEIIKTLIIKSLTYFHFRYESGLLKIPLPSLYETFQFCLDYLLDSQRKTMKSRKVFENLLLEKINEPREYNGPNSKALPEKNFT